LFSNSEDLRIDWRIILEWILGKYGDELHLRSPERIHGVMLSYA